VGLVLADAVSGTFESLVISGALLCATGVLLLSARFVPAPEATAVGPVRGLIIGVAQAAALLPGLSRSGITIVAARWLRVEGPAAARFSFLLAIPAVLGAAVLKLAAESPVEGIRGAPLLAGAAASAVSGTVALLLLLRIVRSGRIHWFAAYCIPAGLLMAIVGLQS
jgi:undecaprenyl-diphosphatase